MSPTARRVAPTEAQFQAAVIAAAQLRGWLVAHFRTAQTASGRHLTPVAGDGAGFPDLVLVGHGRVLWRELKTDTGRVRLDQQRWLDTLRAAGEDAAVWRPRDWPLIDADLRRSTP